MASSNDETCLGDLLQGLVAGLVAGTSRRGLVSSCMPTLKLEAKTLENETVLK